MPPLEVINPHHPRAPFRVSLWDFDGTLSLYRGGWQEVMAQMMVEELSRACPTAARDALATEARQWIVALNGKPTIHQMTWLAETVVSRGGQALQPDEYCSVFQQQLLAVVNQRVALVELGEKQPLDHGVAGVEDMLQALSSRGIALVLASGTEYEYVHRELTALGLQGYFGEHVYAPHGHDLSFSKRGVIERLLREFNISGEQLLSFGDGVVETAEVKRVGGCAVGVASDEHGAPGPDPDKRRQLIEAGADLIVPDFRAVQSLIVELGL